MRPVSVSRWREDKSGLYMECWNGNKWVDNPALRRVIGVGGDSDYDETTEQKANDFIATHKTD